MSISRNSLANLVGALAPLAITIITVPLYISAIGEERYGVLAVIWTVLAYFYFFDAGLGKATSQRIAKLDTSSQGEASNILWTSIWLTLLFGFAGGVALWFAAGFLLNNFLGLSDSSRIEALESIPWLIIFLPVLIVNSALGGALQARERFLQLNAVSILCMTANQILPLIVALSGRVEMKYLIPVSLLGNCLMFVLYFLLARKYVPLTKPGRINKAHTKYLLGYGGRVSLISAVAPLLVTFDRIMIGAILGAKAVTHYVIPFTLSSKMLAISGAVASATFPRMASLDRDEGTNLSLLATKRLSAFLTPLAVSGILCVNPFLMIWLGEGFAQSARGVAEILILGTWINCHATAHHTNLQATGRLNIILKLYLIEIPIYLLVLWMAITSWGVIGAAIAWSFRVFIDTLALLAIADVLQKTLREALWPFCLVSISIFLSFRYENMGSTYLLAVVILPAIAMRIGWQEVHQGIASIFSDRNRSN